MNKQQFETLMIQLRTASLYELMRPRFKTVNFIGPDGFGWYKRMLYEKHFLDGQIAQAWLSNNLDYLADLALVKKLSDDIERGTKPSPTSGAPGER